MKSTKELIEDLTEAIVQEREKTIDNCINVVEKVYSLCKDEDGLISLDAIYDIVDELNELKWE